MTQGSVLDGEFVNMAKNVIKYINTHDNTAPNNLPDTSLGDFMGYNSLVYMFSKILTSYNSTNICPENVIMIPWLAVVNPNKTYNFRLQKIYDSIQAAVDDTGGYR